MTPPPPRHSRHARQRLDEFRLPVGFRGRSALIVQLWWIVQASLFRWSPQFAYPFRAMLLRWFGARVGRGSVIRSSVTVTYPWKVTLGDHVWLGDDVVLYSLGDINIGSHTVVSQRSYLCAADHDHRARDFPIRARPITVGDGCWLAADVFVAPGVSVGDGCVVGARSSVFRDLDADGVYLGSPCVRIRDREGTDAPG